jgi:alkylhydroperoxidase family enzyme
MPVIPPVSEDHVSDQLKTLFEKSKQGTGSNIMVRTLAHNPQLLQQFLQFYGEIWKGSIDPKLKEMIRYRVAVAGQCDY